MTTRSRITGNMYSWFARTLGLGVLARGLYGWGRGRVRYLRFLQRGPIGGAVRFGKCELRLQELHFFAVHADDALAAAQLKGVVGIVGEFGGVY